jgi:peptidoglycan hydrolase-like protein with peptidoglycan-binding domain
VAAAFHNVTSSRSVRYIQYALHARGFEPGNDKGMVDYDTRKAYAEFQRTIDERPTGVPSAYSLNILGFNVS